MSCDEMVGLHVERYHSCEVTVAMVADGVYGKYCKYLRGGGSQIRGDAALRLRRRQEALFRSRGWTRNELILDGGAL